MADMSWKDALVLSSGGGGTGGSGITSYDQLTNRPIQNVSGDPVVISKLPSGVYNIDGTWVITADGEPQATRKDDMFYVLNEDGVCKLAWITAGEIYTYSSQNDGSASSVVEDRVTKESDCKEHGGSGSGSGDIEDLIGKFDESGSSEGDYSDLVGVF